MHPLKLLVLAATLSVTSYKSWEHNVFNLQRTDIRWYQGPSPWTSNHERFDPEGMTYASDIDAPNTVITVLWHGKQVVVRCNDTGPNDVELTRGAFRVLEPLTTGVLRGAIVTRHLTQKDRDDANQPLASERDHSQAGTRS